MYKKVISGILISILILTLGTSLVSATECGTRNRNENITLGMLEDELNNYVAEKYPDMVVGSDEYVEFLTNQLMFEIDKELMQKTNYSDLEFYASKYLSELNNPEMIDRVILDEETTCVELNDSARQLTVKEVKEEIESANRIENSTDIILNEHTISPLAAAYSPSSAVAYARKYANSYNTPTYKKFSADCTNFISQCLVAGGQSMKKPSNYKTLGSMYGTTSYWYSMHWTEVSPYHRYGISSSFVNVGDFYTYWKTRGALVESGLTKAQLQSKAKKGDIVQLRNNNGSWYHTIIITAGSKGAWKYSGHSSARLDYAISNISSSVTYRILRFA